ncbi:type IV secretory system conjugative DNA transfer family protein [Minwuia sp.]|uniref:type IV secretory system conjugative DNA transfer family protein n=1 Tax=Minwuia sp. TaxID=2493630 RepID=UPI003A8EE1A1
MPLHLAARTHAFIHGLFRPGDLQEVQSLHDDVRRLFRRHGLLQPQGRDGLVQNLATEVLLRLGLPETHVQRETVAGLIDRCLAYETLFILPETGLSARASVTELWDLRDQLTAQKHLLENYPTVREQLADTFAGITQLMHDACPALASDACTADGMRMPVPLIRSLGDVGRITEAVCASVFRDELKALGLFSRHRDRLERNLIAASGGNPAADPRSFQRTPRLPSKSDIADPAERVSAYLGGTPLLDVFDQAVPFTIPAAARFEHHHIIAGSGHGKTQTLQYLIGHDLEAVARGERSVVVLDSQDDLIRTLSGLAEFAEGGALADRIVIIDPTDVEWPVSLNLFDVGIERLQGYAPLERERLTNSILELYDFVLGSLLAAEMTQKQSVIFRYVTRLMLHIPDATIHTLRELMEPGSEVRFAAHIDKLTGTARHFFETEFASREFEQTKKQVLRRLWGILENQTFERMFSHPRSKLDLFAEMNAGKIILINTAKDLLKEQGTEIFGRFFIAMIAQAAQERATLPERERMPTFVYVDEAADYFDRNIGIILSQARKYRVGMVLAHQYLGQLEPKLQDAFAANTAIKFAGGVSAKDARALAPMLHCDPALIETRPRGSFAAFVRGETPNAVPLSFPFGALEDRATMPPEARQSLQARMRARYAIHHTELGRPSVDTIPADGTADMVDTDDTAGTTGTDDAPGVSAEESPAATETGGASSTDATTDW